MALGHQMYCTLSIALMLALFSEANLTAVPTDSPYSTQPDTSLDENQLQREYPNPIPYPDHQVERKAQRSPSLRLRFGRRNDPEMNLMPSIDAMSMANVEKRWFGDVHQKPIRSPSLRLRFGRRNDPGMPLHSDFDILMNELTAKNADYNSLDEEYEDNGLERSDRIVRSQRAPRLRWGRSPYLFGGDESPNQDRFPRDQRVPRLRWGRSAHFFGDDESPIRDRFPRDQRVPRLRWGRSAHFFGDDESPIQDRFPRDQRVPRLRWGRSAHFFGGDEPPIQDPFGRNYGIANNELDAEADADDDINERNLQIPLRLSFVRNFDENISPLSSGGDGINEAAAFHERNSRSPLRLRYGRSAGDGEGNIPIPTIPPWILTAVVGEKLKNSPQASDTANKN